MPKLKLDRFRRIYKSLKTPWKPLNWIILGYLIGIEQQYISIRTKQTVDEAISNYKKEVLDVVKKPAVVMKKTDDGWEMSIGEVDKK
jgi:hypothetical protein|tara:strand:+ start:1585 stop:1845 length:261 start_codon:yes stop_codon:yes gene_type:complete